ncbi:MAG: FKBP-type peptidyl-prolyl cis-trans isomerase [Microscillaceae bacterium]|jgi:FKBP-type peptidyl-prolyl cis-trans isomerase|nr:FKBP-type peptidyl-prolyl cis-trans isomerase [Microscillaceae bacterium]
MKKLLYGLLLLSIGLLAACKKNDPEPTTEELKNQIRDYIQRNTINAQQTTSGVYYQTLFTTSTGRNPVKGDLVSLNIKGTYLDNSAIPNSTGTLRLPFGGKAVDGSNYLLKDFEDVLAIARPLDSIRVYLPLNPIQTYNYKVLWIRSESEQIDKMKVDSSFTTTTTTSDLQYIITKQGTGATPSATSNVRVRYTLKNIFGQTIDNSPSANFNLGGQLIVGFKEAVQLLKVGGRGKFILPSKLGYGDTQSGSLIPFSVLYFDIELLESN